MIAGGGVHYSEALPELAELSERLGVPVAETSAGKGALPGGELALGGIGVTGTRAANALAREADLVVCVGTRLIDLTTGSQSLFQHPDVRFVGVNVVAARRAQARRAAGRGRREARPARRWPTRSPRTAGGPRRRGASARWRSARAGSARSRRTSRRATASA